MEWKIYFNIALCLHLVIKIQASGMYISFQANVEKCGRLEEPGFKAISTTECVLYCRLTKCMNALMKDEVCYCTTKTCAVEQGDEGQTQGAIFYQNAGQEIRQLTTTPVCYEAKDDTPAIFKVQKPGRIKGFKLVHFFGYVSCKTEVDHFSSKWGCGFYGKDNRIMTVITDAENRMITYHDELNSKGYIKMPTENAKSKELNLAMVNDEPYDVRGGEEFRVWYTEDLMNGGDFDNGGTHCVHVFAKYC
ncbi:uncharacterized protein [Clytia hemisphaerica]|uniref:Cnidarian restricted protein n=1 Tax=Clytia hemisphaerica TaxID=252671 RepID=A0A7M5X5A3_9CNID